MKKLIIHPTDFSNCANIAYDYALLFAEKLNADILIVHGIDNNQLGDSDLLGHSLITKSKEIEEIAQGKIQALGEKAIGKSIHVKGEIYSGSINSWLPNLIKDKKPFLTIMGTVGAGSMYKKVFGSNTSAIIEGTSFPILAIPESTKIQPISTISLAAEVDKISEHTLSYFDTLNKSLNSTLDIVHVQTKLDQSLEEHMFQDFRSKYPNVFNTVRFRTVIDDDYLAGIQRYLGINQPEIFSILKSDKNYFTKLLFGSLTEKLVYHSKIPLLVLPTQYGNV